MKEAHRNSQFVILSAAKNDKLLICCVLQTLYKRLSALSHKIEYSMAARFRSDRE